MSGGRIIGECLSKNSAFRYVTREDLTASVDALGEQARKVTATIAKAAHDYGPFGALRRPYKILMRMALLEYVRQGNVAYFGYSGHLLLEKLPRVLTARLIAPVQQRVRMLMESENKTKEEAQEYIRTVDDDRVRWARFMYAKNIRDPEQYHLCINLGKTSISAACSILANAAAQEDFQPTAESLTAADDLYLSTRCLVALLTNPQTHSIELGATSNDGKICVEGPYLDAPDRELVVATVRDVPGVRAVEYKPGYAPTFDMSC